MVDLVFCFACVAVQNVKPFYWFGLDFVHFNCKMLNGFGSLCNSLYVQEIFCNVVE